MSTSYTKTRTYWPTGAKQFTWRERQTDRQTDRQIDRQTDRQKEMERDRKSERHEETEG